MVMVIGLTGYAGVGKTLVAKILEEKHGFVRASFADPLKAVANRLPHIQPLIQQHGVEAAKRQCPEVRETYQALGHGFREEVSEYFWTDLMSHRLQSNALRGRNVVIDDVRYQNETELCDYVVHVERDGYGPLNRHITEVGVTDIATDLSISNNGTLDDLREDVSFMYDMIRETTNHIRERLGL